MRFDIKDVLVVQTLWLAEIPRLLRLILSVYIVFVNILGGVKKCQKC